MAVEPPYRTPRQQQAQDEEEMYEMTMTGSGFRITKYVHYGSSVTWRDLVWVFLVLYLLHLWTG